MRTDIKVTLMMVDPSLEMVGESTSRVKSLSQIQAFINQLITKGELVKYQITPTGNNNLLIFEIIRTK
jgi:hypothetical protein